MAKNQYSCKYNLVLFFISTSLMYKSNEIFLFKLPNNAVCRMNSARHLLKHYLMELHYWINGKSDVLVMEALWLDLVAI